MTGCRLGSGICYTYSMETLKQPNDYNATETRGNHALKAASLLLCSVLTGCASSWVNLTPSANSPPSSLPPVSEAVVPSRPPTSPATATAPLSDGVHPNQSITDLFRDPSSPGSANIPRPPSSYTPTGHPYTPPGQPAFGGPQNAGDASTEPSLSDGVHPNQSITDIFHQ